MTGCVYIIQYLGMLVMFWFSQGFWTIDRLLMQDDDCIANAINKKINWPICHKQKVFFFKFACVYRKTFENFMLKNGP